MQAFTFLLGGYETTASALGFTIVLLSSNPDKVAKLAQVILSERTADTRSSAILHSDCPVLAVSSDLSASPSQELDNFGRARTPVNADLERLPYTQVGA